MCWIGGGGEESFLSKKCGHGIAGCHRLLLYPVPSGNLCMIHESSLLLQTGKSHGPCTKSHRKTGEAKSSCPISSLRKICAQTKRSEDSHIGNPRSFHTHSAAGMIGASPRTSSMYWTAGRTFTLPYNPALHRSSMPLPSLMSQVIYRTS